MTVHLVGAGPGDPGLLTIKARDLLAEADVVLYDDLVDARVLGLVGERTRKIGVGKVGRAGRPAPTDPVARSGRHAPVAAQNEINRLLVEYGRRAASVVRLKGGDPFVFGRGGEEALALAAAGVPYEIVPGVSSAIAAPAYAGIPITQRGLASSITIVTGHEAPDKPPGSAHVDWRGLGAHGGDTLVILMGVSHLPHIAAELIKGGRAADTPAAVIERGTTPEQRVVTGTLRELPALAAAAGVQSPACIVVGDVVALRRDIAWFDQPIEAAAPATLSEATACA